MGRDREREDLFEPIAGRDMCLQYVEARDGPFPVVPLSGNGGGGMRWIRRRLRQIGHLISPIDAG